MEKRFTTSGSQESSVGQGIIPLSIQEAFNFPWTFLYTASLFVIVLGY
jgi:hypothetical protein